jgi:hypothetical protein
VKGEFLYQMYHKLSQLNTKVKAKVKADKILIISIEKEEIQVEIKKKVPTRRIKFL